MKDGRRFGGPPNPYQPPDVPAGKVNITDPDSKPIPIGFGFVQGYNDRAAVNEQQIVVAAEITNNSADFSQLDPMVTATLDELEKAGIEQLPEAVARARPGPAGAMSSCERCSTAHRRFTAVTVGALCLGRGFDGRARSTK
jgi:hypothetical protein